ncbi:quercetin 2,3-dioxygenase [Paenibacillus dauci]|uniref:quercetin 2,3-dioxygenase n=1 Tax=Paenibacillus dauci TaxID=1567106 RepID=UPI000619573D|nr:quercetin 2,3-dioxygenase [Paenibacillus dauci]
MTTTQLITHLPQEKMPYLLRRGDGERYLFGNQVATIIANAESTGDIFSAAVIGGPKGESFPMHTHPNTYESIYVMEGRLQFVIDGQSHLLLPGDYAHITPGTEHAYQLLGHRNSFISYSISGDITKVYPALGQSYEHIEYPPFTDHAYSEEHRRQAEQNADIVFSAGSTEFPAYELVSNTVVPDEVSNYVLESGEGIRLLTGDQVHRLLATQKTTDGGYIIVASDGPKGDEIVSHYHDHHTETFFCTQGRMTMWANDEEIQLFPGDFLHVPAGTVHSYRLDDHFTKVVGLLVSGLFEPFFRLLGDEYEHYMFPNNPGPARIDRLMENIDKLDLNVVGPPNSHQKK